VFLLFTGLAARFRAVCARVTGGREFLTLLLFAAAYLTLAALVVLPVAFWLEVAHRLAWKLPASSPGEWLAGRAMNLVAQLVGAALLIWIPFALIRRAPRWWWLAAATFAWLLVSAVLIAEQVWIRPMTTHIEPLAAGPLKARFDALAARCGADHVPIFVGGQDEGGRRVGVVCEHETCHQVRRNSEHSYIRYRDRART
jgi:STE24 endopeptidase